MKPLTKSFLILLLGLLSIGMLFPAAVSAQQNSDPVDIVLVASATELEVGDTLTATVEIQAGTQTMETAEIYLGYNDTVLSLTNATPITTTLTTSIGGVDTSVSGEVYYNAAVPGPGSSVSGTFDFLELEFEAIAEGTADFNYLTGLTRNTRAVEAGVDLTDETVAPVVTVSAPPPPLPDPEICINAGGPAFTSLTTGYNFLTDNPGTSPYTNGQKYAPGAVSSAEIANTDDDVIFRSERYGGQTTPPNQAKPPMVFNLGNNLAPGSYRVQLYFAEIFHGVANNTTETTGERVFDVSIEDTQVLDDFDIIGETGANLTAIITEHDVDITDGQATISFVSSADNAKVSALCLFLLEEFPPTYTITASAGAGGSISPSGPVTVTQGDSQTFTISPDTGFQIADVLVDGSSVGAVPSYEFTNVQADATITASFEEIPPNTYTITASAGAGGSISPSGPVSVTQGDSQTFTISPNTGFQIADVLVDGSSVGAVPSYEFTNVQADATITASFEAIPINTDVIMALDPATATANVGDTVSVDVTLSTEQSFDLAEAHIDFDPTVLNVTGFSNVTSALPVELVAPAFNNSNGTVDFSLGALGNFPNSDLTLLTIEFEVVGTGTTGLTFTDRSAALTTRVTSAGTDILTQAVDGSITGNGAALVVTKDDGVDSVLLGDALSYTITVENQGNAPATNVSLTDPLDPILTFVSVSPSQQCGFANGVVTCNFASIAANSSVTVTINTLVQLADNTGSYTITAANNSPFTDPNLSLSHTLPTDVIVTGVNPAALCQINAGVVTCDFGATAPNTTQTLTVNFQLDDVPTEVVNTVIVDGETATVTTPIGQPPTNTPPTIAPITDQLVKAGETVSITATATDVDDIPTDVPTLSINIVNNANQQPVPANAYAFTESAPGTYNLVWNTTVADVGTYTATVSGTDGVNNAAPVTFTITVQDQVSSAFLAVNPGGGLGASTFGNNSFQISNTGEADITSISIDLSTAFMPDVVFDPVGTAGDENAKCVTPGTSTGTPGFVSPADPCVTPFSAPHNGVDNDEGYDVVTLSFTDFNPNEQFNFGVDIDPTSIKGDLTSGDAGSISGFELIGSTVTFTFANGDTWTGSLFDEGTLGGSEVLVAGNAPAAPSIAVDGITTQGILNTLNPTATITGPANATVTLLQVDGRLYIDPGNPTIGYDIDPFEANEAMAKVLYTTTLNGSGQGVIPVTLLQTASTNAGPDGGINHFVAVVEGTGNQNSQTSNVVVVEYEEPIIEGTPNVLVEITPDSDFAASTFSNGSLQITNNSVNLDVTSVSIDLSSAILPDNVFDPIGTGGDATAKCLIVNTGAGNTGYVAPTDNCTDPFSAPRGGGFDIATLNFTDFNPGEFLAFTVDIDPNSIKDQAGAGEAGAVSGLEMAGATITATFSDGSTVTASLYEDGSNGGGQAIVTAAVPAAPIISVVGVPSTPAQVTSANQTINVNGPANHYISLLQLDTQLSLKPGTPFTTIPFYANEAIDKVLYTAQLNGSGNANIPVTLLTAGGNNRFMAVVSDTPYAVDSAHSATSNLIVLELVPNTAPIITPITDQVNTAGDSPTLQVVASDPDTPLSYAATDLPLGLSINPTTGLISGTVQSCPATGGGSSAYTSTNNIFVVDVEDAYNGESQWAVENSATPFSGSGYIVGQNQNLGTPGQGTLSYQLQITTPGKYRFQWRSAFLNGNNSTEHNDSWLRFPDADLYYGEKSGSIVYAQGAQDKAPAGATAPNGAGGNGWFKIFRSGGSNGQWNWVTSTSDNDAHQIFAEFFSPGIYTVEISRRSSFHGIDRFILYPDGALTQGQLESQPVSPQGSVGSTPASCTYNVAVTVTDSGTPAASSTANFVWTVNQPAAPNTPPVALASSNSPVIDTNADGFADVTLSAAGSNDPDGTITNFSWSLTNGGSSLGSGQTLTESFPLGTTNVTLTVTDNDGATATATITVEVIEQPEGLAVIQLLMTDANGSLAPVTLQDGATYTIGVDPLPASFNIEAITNVAPGSVLFTGNLNGIPVTKTENVTPYEMLGSNGSQTLAPGTYSITATPYTGSSLGGSEGTPLSVTFTVVEPSGPNVPPTALASSDSPVVDADEDDFADVTLDGSGSSDSDGTIVSYAWEVANGDLLAIGVNPTVSLPVGTTSVTLTVTDDDGATDETTIEVIVNTPQNAAPTALASSNSPVTDADEDGFADVTLDGSGSSDSDGTIVAYAWSLTNGDLLAIGVNPTVSLPVGTTSVTLTVTDDDGATDETTIEVIVNAPEVPGECGPLLQQAENGDLTPEWQTLTDLGETYIVVENDSQPQNQMPSGNGISATYCFTVPASGTYELTGWTFTEGLFSNSFWVEVNGAAPVEWSVTRNSFTSAFTDSFMPNTLNETLTLSEGTTEIVISVREDGARLDQLELVPLSTNQADLAIEALTVLDPISGTSLMSLEDGAVINLADLPNPSIIIEADTGSTEADMTIFNFIEDDDEVAAATGDLVAENTETNQTRWTPMPGTYSLAAIPLADGEVGKKKQITFTVINDPNPTENPSLAVDEVDVLGNSGETLPPLDTSEVEAPVDPPSP